MAVAAEPKARKRAPVRSGRRLMNYDRALGHRYVAGADEAGRGCLAGPLVAAGVLLDLDRIGPREVRALGLLDDSKKHDEQTRASLYPIVLSLAARVAVVSRCAPGIDRRGLHVTNLAALRDALMQVAAPGTICLSDGFAIGEISGCQTRAVIGGDGKSAAIAAASIIAKVTRDRLMKRVAALHPDWLFEQHVGYSTPAHRDAISAHGVSPLHRMSFASTAYTQLTL